MEDVKITVNGITELTNALRRVPNEFKVKCIKPAIMKSGMVVVNAIKRSAPVSSAPHRAHRTFFTPGSLKRSVWRIVHSDSRADDVVAFVGPQRKKGSKVFYSPFVISGNRKNNKKARPNPFVLLAWRQSRAVAYQVMKDEIFSNIKKLGFS